jgi:hypothetical protein
MKRESRAPAGGVYRAATVRGSNQIERNELTAIRHFYIVTAVKSSGNAYRVTQDCATKQVTDKNNKHGALPSLFPLVFSCFPDLYIVLVESLLQGPRQSLSACPHDETSSCLRCGQQRPQ